MRKIMSWNINVFNTKENGDIITRSENILKTIRSHSPDILVLQEGSDYFIGLLSTIGVYKNEISLEL